MFQGLHESLMKTVCAKLGEIVFTFHVNEKGIINAIIFYQNQQVNILLLFDSCLKLLRSEERRVGMGHLSEWRKTWWTDGT